MYLNNDVSKILLDHLELVPKAFQIHVTNIFVVYPCSKKLELNIKMAILEKISTTHLHHNIMCSFWVIRILKFIYAYKS